MKKHSYFIKYLFIVIIVLILATIVTFALFYQSLKSETPQLSDLAQRVGKPAFAIAFNYTTNTDRQLYLFSKNIGLENNPRTQQNIPPLGEIGARGFFIIDLHPQQSDKPLNTLDNILNDFLSTSEDSESSDEDIEFFDPSSSVLENSKANDIYISEENKNNDSNYNNRNVAKNLPAESPFSKPLTSLIEELWNGNTIEIGGATQLQLSLKDSLLLATEPNIKKSLHLSSNTLTSLILKNTPISIQSFLNSHAIDISTESLEFDSENKVNHSQIVISISDPLEFLNSICTQKINPWDFCGRFSFNRNTFRRNIESFLSLLNTDFNIKLNMYWTIKGHTFIFSNKKSFVTKIIDEKTPKDPNNILTFVSSSGADYLLPTETSKNYSSISFLFDMIRSQNRLIDFIERVRNKSVILSDYFSSPSGEVIFSNFESTINRITSYSESASLTLDTDGEKLIPRIRLYSPTGDLFINHGKDLNPEAINAMRIFITKAVSFGNYLLPRGLITMPGPYLKRNGKWVIIQSEILVKSIAPYLESIDPYIETNEDATKL